jgi:SAM-dependent methyltransferase
MAYPPRIVIPALKSIDRYHRLTRKSTANEHLIQHQQRRIGQSEKQHGLNAGGKDLSLSSLARHPKGIIPAIEVVMKSRHKIVLVVLILSAIALPVCGQDYQAEPARLAKLLGWQAGSVVAEIGSGAGQMTLDAAERVGPRGHVYTTEVNPQKLAHLKELAAEEKDRNITVIEGAQSGTNLPAACCDSMYMRRVYHHFTEPEKIDASIYQSLKPGGMLAVIDFPPRAWLPPVKDVPPNRGGHGIPKKILIQELTAAGFKVVSEPAEWPDNNYCVIFRKPEN